MSHWAQVDEHNIVVNVLIGNNDEPDEGYQWMVNNHGGRWIKTSINTYGGVHIQGGIPLRKNYAGIGYTYDEILDAFIPPKPEQFPSFIIDEDTGLWKPPFERPSDGNVYSWDESSISWKIIESPYPSWIIVDGRWSAPIPFPNDGKMYSWDESNCCWQEIEVSLNEE